MTFTKTPLLLALAGTLGLSACVSTDPMNDPNRTRTGAIVGGVAGALAGAARDSDGDAGDRNRNILVGAALGAGSGAAVGSFLDRQEAELRAQLGNGIVIQNTGSELIVRMPQDILFATDSASLNPALSGDLRLLAASLNKYNASTVEIQGHTDNTGSAAYNQDLSERRAQSVTSALIQNGVPAARLRTVGYGENRPISSNLTPEGRAQNRRVQIVIRPTT